MNKPDIANPGTVFAPLEMTLRCPLAGLGLGVILAEFDLPQEFLTGFVYFSFLKKSPKFSIMAFG